MATFNDLSKKVHRVGFHGAVKKTPEEAMAIINRVENQTLSNRGRDQRQRLSNSNKLK